MASFEGQEAAVLCSAGLDSVVLLAHEAQRGPVTPVYVSVGLAWEDAERRALTRVLAAPVYAGRTRPVAVLELTMRDVYAPTHWALTGQPPAYDTPDEDVYLVGRNLVLLTKAGIYAAQRGLGRLVMGPLAGNPFPDARPAFFEAMARALTLGLEHVLTIEAPFASWHKEDVIRRGMELGVPLAQSLSCMNPRGDLHCGACSKCRERHDAFVRCGLTDPTSYAAPPPR
jgi:7-cyano-7-deazaguanine synthase